MDKKQLGRNIKLIRQTKNITREDLAKKLNISYSSIEKYEQGLRGFRVEIIDKFAEALGVSVFELLDNKYDKA
ncbi:helix-turn-helix domain-containing protein, partial [Romboutsia ilealis]|uniref:helix-turn-helix domain-containing protein n=1 Tax=Romboutsia ilealis TaxID=1115758 RepID=UPI002674DBBB